MYCLTTAIADETVGTGIVDGDGTDAIAIKHVACFTNYPTAISIVAATGVIIGGRPTGEGNSISNATNAGIYATGFCTGSSVIYTAFPTGVIASKQYVVATSRFLNVVRLPV